MKFKHDFEKMNDITYIAVAYIGEYQRHYHVVDHEDYATLKIFGIDRLSEVEYPSVKLAMEAAEEIHNTYMKERYNI